MEEKKLIKKEFPILEFDESKEAHIEPRIKSDIAVSNRLVINFLKKSSKNCWKMQKFFL